MTTNTTTPEANTTDETLEDQPVVATEAPSKEKYAEKSWQETVQKSSVLFKRSGDAKKRASVLLWQGATGAIGEWETNSDTDINGESLATELLIIMGTARKGDVSKIKTVALAVKNNGLDTAQFPNLSKAYGEAIRLTKTAVAEATEDTAGDEAIAAISEDAPKTATTIESAMRMAFALAGGFDEFFRVFGDVIDNGGSNVEAQRSALRSHAQDVSGRAKPAPAPVVDGDEDKAGAAKATKAPAKKAAAKKAPSKPKPTAKAPVEQAEAPVEAADEAADLFNEVDAEDATEAPAPVKAPAKPKPAAVRRA